MTKTKYLLILLVICTVATWCYIGISNDEKSEAVAEQSGGLPDVSYLQVVDEGTLTVNKPINTILASTTYTHNLHYFPAYIVYIDGVDDDGNPQRQQLPYTGYIQAGTDAGKAFYIVTASVTDTIIKVRVYTPNIPSGAGSYASAIDVNIKFYLLNNSSN